MNANSQAALRARRDAGTLTWNGPALMLFARGALGVAEQAVVVAILILRGSRAPWHDSAPWLPVYATLIDAGCLTLLWCLTGREGIRLFDLAGFERSRLGRDALLGLALVPASLVFIFAVTSLAVYGIITGGWASNNKYSALGALRSSAQVISYEIPLGMSILGVALLGGTLNLERIIAQQAEGGFWSWYVWTQPLACLIFFISALAESNRLPFDLPEAEQELVGGYHTEYSAMKFAMFFLGEYTHVITISFLVSVVFFGVIDERLAPAEVGPAFADGFQHALGYVAAVMGVIFLLMFALPKRPAQHVEGAGEAPVAVEKERELVA